MMEDVISTTPNRIKISIHDIIEIEVESPELSFSELKKEAIDMFGFAKNNMLGTKPSDNEVS